MPRAPKPAAAHQVGRKKLRHTVTLDPETVERYARIQATVPQLDGLSAAIRYAGIVTLAQVLADERSRKGRRG